MSSYTLANTSVQIKDTVSGAYTALFGGGFAGNLRVNGVVSGIDSIFQTTTSTDSFSTNIETSDLNVSSSLLIEGVGRYTKPQHFNSGILIGRNAAPNFFVPTLVVSGVSEFKYPVYMGGWNASPILTISGSAAITGDVQASSFTVTGQILPYSENVSGRIPIFNANTGTFSQTLITGGRSSMFSEGYDLTVNGDAHFAGQIGLFDGEIITDTVTINTSFSSPVGTITSLTSSIINGGYITGHSGYFPFSLVLPTGNAPTIATSPGTLGQVALKNSRLYICTGTNQWGSLLIGAFA